MSNYTDGMTLEEQIGQLLMVGFWETTPSEEAIDRESRRRMQPKTGKFGFGQSAAYAAGAETDERALAIQTSSA